MAKLSPIKQEWYEDNRERFDAETTFVDLPRKEIQIHDFYRFSTTEIKCKHCNNGWIDTTGALLPLK